MIASTSRRPSVRLALFAAISAAALTVACSGPPQGANAPDAPADARQSGEGAEGEQNGAPTAFDAAEFLSRVEADLREFGEYSARVGWVQQTYINYDTNWLATKANERAVEMGVAFANEAKRFNGVDLPPEMRRKIEMIKLAVDVPAPTKQGAAGRLAALNTRMGATYETGKIELDGQLVARNDLEAMMGAVRDPARLAEIWTKWRAVPTAPDADGNTMKADYARMVEIANEGARELGYADVGAMWRSQYDMAPDEFAAELDRLWGQVRPLYEQLHCHVRARLGETYGETVVPPGAPIRADLLGNMWAQSWGNIYDLVAPAGADPGFDLTERLVANGYDPVKMVRTGEAFFSSLGFDPLPETFWERSQIVKPDGREAACHASAWDLDWANDIRIKMCTKVNADDFRVVHHELGHNYYQRAYQNRSVIFQTGANGGFHEAIGDMVALSITPEYLQQTGLLEALPDASKDVGLLMRQALDKVAFLPFGLMMDKWRWQVFSGELTPETYNDGWWALRTEYQGITPPTPRSASDFDPGAKYHIPGNVSYSRYFVAAILQFQFHKAACDIAGWEGPLHRCSVYGSQAVGERFKAMLELGAEKPWPDALEAFTGVREMDGGAIVDYFAPLMAYLEEQNANRQCGWR